MITIRTADRNDIDILYDLIMEIARYHDQVQYVVTSKEEMLESGFGNNPKFGALIAEYDGKVAGYLSYTWNYSIWNGSDYMNLDDLFVWSEFRGKKVGLNLMQYAKNVCISKNIKMMRWEVESDNMKAIAFYKKLGAEIKEKGIFKWHFDL